MMKQVLQKTLESLDRKKSIMEEKKNIRYSLQDSELVNPCEILHCD